MIYRDDLIRRMQQDGSWNQLTGDMQTEYQNLTDEQARQYMVLQDGFEMGDSDAVEKVGSASLANLACLFDMNLLEIDDPNRPRLSNAGRLLAEFAKELLDKGVDQGEIVNGFARLDWLAITNLKLLDRLP